MTFVAYKATTSVLGGKPGYSLVKPAECAYYRTEKVSMATAGPSNCGGR